MRSRLGLALSLGLMAVPALGDPVGTYYPFTPVQAPAVPYILSLDNPIWRITAEGQTRTAWLTYWNVIRIDPFLNSIFLSNSNKAVPVVKGSVQPTAGLIVIRVAPLSYSKNWLHRVACRISGASKVHFATAFTGPKVVDSVTQEQTVSPEGGTLFVYEFQTAPGPQYTEVYISKVGDGTPWEFWGCLVSTIPAGSPF